MVVGLRAGRRISSAAARPCAECGNAAAAAQRPWRLCRAQVANALLKDVGRKITISILYANQTEQDILCLDQLDKIQKDPRCSVRPHWQWGGLWGHQMRSGPGDQRRRWRGVAGGGN